MSLSRALLSLALALPAAAALAVPEGPAYPSPEWSAREAANFARVGDGPAEQAASADFQLAWHLQSLANFQEWTLRAAADPSWLGPPSGNTLLTPLCSSWGEQCVGDPFRYPAATGADGAAFYDNEAEVVPVLFHDRGCARISGRVWAPRAAGNGLPAVVIENGSVQAPETLYWWAAQLLVRAGYVVMTFDPRGQGRSDQQTPEGEQGSNANVAVFTDGLVDAIDFFRSSSVQPYPHNARCEGRYPTPTTTFNPLIARVDPHRLGIAGHSAGAGGVLNVQGLGAPGADPWPGLIDLANPVVAAVAWDSTLNPHIATGGASSLPGAGVLVEQAQTLTFVPRVPTLGQLSEYGLVPVAYSAPPDPDSHTIGYRAFRDAGIPAIDLTIQGSSHYEWSLLPTFPASSWCAAVEDGRCAGGWGRPLAEHYTLAWFDRWLKRPGEPGHDDADARLLDDAAWRERLSFYFRSARSFPARDGTPQLCEDIRAGCPAPSVPQGGGSAAGDFGAGAAGSALWAGLLLLLGLRRRLAEPASLTDPVRPEY